MTLICAPNFLGFVERAELLTKECEPSRARTCDPLIKSPQAASFRFLAKSRIALILRPFG